MEEEEEEEDHKTSGWTNIPYPTDKIHMIDQRNSLGHLILKRIGSRSSKI
jgi:hypothetical protein